MNSKAPNLGFKRKTRETSISQSLALRVKWMLKLAEYNTEFVMLTQLCAVMPQLTTSLMWWKETKCLPLAVRICASPCDPLYLRRNYGRNEEKTDNKTKAELCGDWYAWLRRQAPEQEQEHLFIPL